MPDDRSVSLHQIAAPVEQPVPHSRRQLDEKLDAFGEADDSVGACGLMEEFLSLNPDDWDTHIRLAWEYFNHDDEDLAISNLRKLEPDLEASSGAEVIATLATFLNLRGRNREALTEMERVQSIEPRESPIFRDTLQDILGDMGWPVRSYVADPPQGRPSGRRELIHRTRRYWSCGGPFDSVKNAQLRIEADSERRWKLWSTNVQRLDELVDALPPVVEQAKLDLDNYILQLANLSYKYHAVDRAIRRSVPIAVPLIGYILLVFYLSYSKEVSLTQSVPVDALVCTAIAASLAAALEGGSRLIKSSRRLLISGIMTALLLATLALAILTSSPEPEDVRRAFAVAMASVAILGPVVYVAVRVPEYLHIQALGRLRSRMPRAAIIDPLLDLYSEVTDPIKRSKVELRDDWARLIEISAQRLERDLPQSFNLFTDEGTKSWLTTRSTGAAEAIRVIKRKILVPRESTWDSIQRDLRRAISALASGNYGELHWISPRSPLSQKLDRSARLVNVIKIITLMLLPAIAVVAIGYTGGIDPTVLSWAKVASIAWFFLYLAVTLDPAIREKVELARSVAGILQSSPDSEKRLQQ